MVIHSILLGYGSLSNFRTTGKCSGRPPNGSQLRPFGKRLRNSDVVSIDDLTSSRTLPWTPGLNIGCMGRFPGKSADTSWDSVSRRDTKQCARQWGQGKTKAHQNLRTLAKATTCISCEVTITVPVCSRNFIIMSRQDAQQEGQGKPKHVRTFSVSEGYCMHSYEHPIAKAKSRLPPLTVPEWKGYWRAGQEAGASIARPELTATPSRWWFHLPYRPLVRIAGNEAIESLRRCFQYRVAWII